MKIPDRRLEKLVSTFDSVESCMSQSQCVHVRKVASLVGQIISMHFVVGNIVYLMTKSLSYEILSVPSWNSEIHLSSQSLSIISFWRT